MTHTHGFHPRDPLALANEYHADERAIQDTVAAFCRDHISPHIASWYETGTIPGLRDLARELGQLGVFGMTLTGYGCAGTGAIAYGLACCELEACDSGIRSLVSVQGSLAMYAIWRYGSQQQKQHWLPRMANGDVIGCFGLTEPEHGSDPARMRTRAHRDGTDWILNGTKLWITNGSIADIAIIWAHTHDGIRGFVVPTTTPGFTATPVPAKMSLRASVTSQLTFNELRLPADAVLPTATGLGAALRCLNEARYGIIWGSMGAARACLDIATDYAATREQFGSPIGAYQLTQAKLVDMSMTVHQGLLLAWHLGRLKDNQTLHPEQVSFGKLNNTRTALDVARQARTILGANGIAAEIPIMRHMANLESVLTYEGTAEMHTLILGNALTGMPAFTRETTRGN